MATPRELIAQCLFEPEQLEGIDQNDPVAWAEENGIRAVVSEGPVHNFFLSMDALEGIRETILEMMERLPEPFRESGGGGWTFLNACLDGEWQHIDIEALICMGNALGLSRYCLPKEMWPSMPGGLPYFTYLDVTNGIRDKA